MSNFSFLYKLLEYLFLTYFFLYHSLNLCFVVLSFFEVRRKVIGRGFEDLDMVMDSPFTPPLSIIVPAFEEEVTIIESIRSLMNLRFPRFEIVVVNDGSTDRTQETLIEAFDLRRMDISYREDITTAPVKGLYEFRGDLPPSITRFVLVDKENGGKADAMNAGINASLCPYFVAIDADSVIDEAALLQSFRVILNNSEIKAVGGQLAILNDCQVRGGRISRIRLSDKWVVRFQIVEYLRAFTMSRTAMARMGSLLIISGGFGVFNKAFVKNIGGYLTEFLTSKLALEYTGRGKDTVCEDIELIVRMQRYIREKKLDFKVGYVPHPLCWTEAPGTFRILEKQRNRWHRGLIETLLYHRKIAFNPRYGRIGLFAFPYYVIFEFLGVFVEFGGYLSLPVLFYLDGLNREYLLIFLLISIGYGVLVSVAAIVISAWPERLAETDYSGKTLVYFSGTKEIFILVLTSILENFGYRQITVWWRIKATIDFFMGKKGWDKFEREGFLIHDDEGGDNAKAYETL